MYRYCIYISWNWKQNEFQQNKYCRTYSYSGQNFEISSATIINVALPKYRSESGCNFLSRNHSHTLIFMFEFESILLTRVRHKIPCFIWNNEGHSGICWHSDGGFVFFMPWLAVISQTDENLNTLLSDRFITVGCKNWNLSATVSKLVHNLKSCRGNTTSYKGRSKGATTQLLSL